MASSQAQGAARHQAQTRKHLSSRQNKEGARGLIRVQDQVNGVLGRIHAQATEVKVTVKLHTHCASGPYILPWRFAGSML